MTIGQQEKRISQLRRVLEREIKSQFKAQQAAKDVQQKELAKKHRKMVVDFLFCLPITFDDPFSQNHFIWPARWLCPMPNSSISTIGFVADGK